MRYTFVRCKKLSPVTWANVLANGSEGGWATIVTNGVQPMRSRVKPSSCKTWYRSLHSLRSWSFNQIRERNRCQMMISCQQVRNVEITSCRDLPRPNCSTLHCRPCWVNCWIGPPWRFWQTCTWLIIDSMTSLLPIVRAVMHLWMFVYMTLQI